MTSREEYVEQANALLDGDLSEAHVDVQSLAATYRSRQDDDRAHVYARALVNRARSEGVKVGTGRGGSVTVKDLQAEIARRNEGRDEAAQITPASQRKDDLQAALDADDAANG